MQSSAPFSPPHRPSMRPCVSLPLLLRLVLGAFQPATATFAPVLLLHPSVWLACPTGNEEEREEANVGNECPWPWLMPCPAYVITRLRWRGGGANVFAGLGLVRDWLLGWVTSPSCTRRPKTRQGTLDCWLCVSVSLHTIIGHCCISSRNKGEGGVLPSSVCVCVCVCA